MADAEAFGLNAVSDGYHVVLPQTATGFIEQLRERGYHPIGVDMSELHKSGGAVKCCTLELPWTTGAAAERRSRTPIESRACPYRDCRARGSS